MINLLQKKIGYTEEKIMLNLLAIVVVAALSISGLYCFGTIGYEIIKEK